MSIRQTLSHNALLVACWWFAKRLINRLVLLSIHYRYRSVTPEMKKWVVVKGQHIRINDGRNFYIQYKDEWQQGIYRFQTDNSTPRIIDGGSNMGMSVAFFKWAYPEASVIAFEPDPNLFGALQEVVARNNWRDVQLENCGLYSHDGKVSFQPDGAAAGMISDDAQPGMFTIDCRRLSPYIDGPIDFMKLNIEGSELAVLTELAESKKLRFIKQMVVEYHGWSMGRQYLGELLSLLDREGFRYLIHDFDTESNFATKPPFVDRPEMHWFCLIYATRRSPDADPDSGAAT